MEWRTFWFSKVFWKGGWHFYHFKGEGAVYIERLAEISFEGGYNFEKLNCILVLSFSQFSKIV